MDRIKKFEPIFGEWYAESFIGAGSFGRVYKIYREELGEKFYSALKYISIPSEESEVKQLRADGMDDQSISSYYTTLAQDISSEIRLMSRLRGNSNIVCFEDSKIVTKPGGIGYDVFIRMELLSSLTDCMVKNPLSKDDVVKLGIDILGGLTLCAKKGIIHRDIKPDNIFISENGDYKLGDFGIARQLEKTATFMSKKGTYNYMAPEVYKGERYGATCDIYSLGLVMYRLLNNGRLPFLPPVPNPITPSDRENALTLRFKGEPLPIPCNSDDRLSQIVLKACAFYPGDRYSSAVEMREALLAYDKDSKGAPIPAGGLLYATGSVAQAAGEPSASDSGDAKVNDSHGSQNDIDGSDATSGIFTAAPVAVRLPDGQRGSLDNNQGEKPGSSGSKSVGTSGQNNDTGRLTGSDKSVDNEEKGETVGIFRKPVKPSNALGVQAVDDGIRASGNGAAVPTEQNKNSGGAENPQTDGGDKQPAESKKKKKKTAIIVIAIVCLLALAAILFFALRSCNSTPGEEGGTSDVGKVKTLESISIAQYPDKMEYYSGDQVDMSGLQVRLNYSDGSSEVVTQGISLTPQVLEGEGYVPVTVYVEGHEDVQHTFDMRVFAVQLSEVSIAKLPDKISYLEGEEFTLQGFELAIKYNNGSTETATSGFSSNISGKLSRGTQTVKVSYQGYEVSFEITVVPATVDSIIVEKKPSKIQYVEGEQLDITGLVLRVNMNDGTSSSITEGFDWNPKGSLMTGTQTVTVNYGGKSTTFTVDVRTKSITSISVTKKPNKTSYYVSETLDTAGLVVRVLYDNGSTEDLTSGFSVSPDGALTSGGEKTITVTYGGKSTTFTVSVTAVSVSSITIAQNPSKASYYVGEALNTSGLKLTVKYNNGSTETVTSGFSCDPNGTFTSAGSKTITVTYGGKSTTFTVSVTAVAVSSISIAQNPSKTSYYVGDSLNTSGLKITVKYNNGSTETVTSGFSCEPSGSFTSAGTKTITVTYGGKSTTFTVSVTALAVSSISIAQNPNKTSYYVGDSLNTSGLKITVKYNNGSTETVTSGFSCEPSGTFTSAGTKTITVTYGGKSTTFTVSVTALSVSSISIAQKPNKTSYYVGDSLNTSGLKITVKYNNGSTETVTSGFSCEPSGTFTSAGTKTITVTYGGKSTTFTVSVTALSVSSISIAQKPSKTSYYVGDSLNTNGLKLTVNYNNGSTETITGGYSCDPDGTFTTSGTKTITVTYGGKTASFNVSVSTPTITGLPSSYELAISCEKTFSVTTTPSGQSVQWSTSNSNVIKNQGNGRFKAVKHGSSATITAKFTYAGREYSQTCTISVPTPVVSTTRITNVDDYRFNIRDDGSYDSSYYYWGIKVYYDTPGYSVIEFGNTGDSTYQTSKLSESCSMNSSVIESKSSYYFVTQPGTYYWTWTLYYDGYVIKQLQLDDDVVFEVTQSGYNHMYQNHDKSSTIILRDIPKQTHVVLETWYSGEAGVAGTKCWQKITYKGKTGWIQTFSWS